MYKFFAQKWIFEVPIYSNMIRKRYRVVRKVFRVFIIRKARRVVACWLLDDHDSMRSI